MNVRYTRRALAQIDRALSYIEERSPQGADRVRDRVSALAVLLHDQPYAGRATSRPGVRRLTATPYPYLIDYRVTPTEVIIMRFRHAARKPIG
ncbi:type II toxin-antitoxin system RelE/ParE family toxin [Bradyrhizobium genosp. L]|uniref:type II toxin-antitoxin system RelE/ParE family toxin n=1 Tax=Bradyrhizobium genosp. L TaxID=83637 RepID=UPI0032DED210